MNLNNGDKLYVYYILRDSYKFISQSLKNCCISFKLEKEY